MKIVLTALVAVVALLSAAPARASSPIFVAGDGIWHEPSVSTGNGSGYTDWNVWVDASVENLAYEKVVGMVWTDDGWATQHRAYLRYERALHDGREQWGVDLRPAGRFDYARFRGPLWINALSGDAQPTEIVTIEYALFYEVKGHTYWANDGGQNYRVEIEGVVGARR